MISNFQEIRHLRRLAIVGQSTVSCTFKHLGPVVDSKVDSVHIGNQILILALVKIEGQQLLHARAMGLWANLI